MAKIPMKKMPELLKILEKEQVRSDERAKASQKLIAKLKQLKAGGAQLKKELATEDD